MRWLGDKPFHRFLLLTEVPGRWPPRQVAPVAVVLAAAAGWIWSRAVAEAGLGWAVALSLLALALADWALLTSLPRRGLSFGPAQPPWLGLVLARWLLAVATVPLASRWPLPALGSLLLLQILIWLLAAHSTLIEPFGTEVSRLALSSAKLANPGEPIRIVQLSDLHVERLTRRERGLPALVAGLSPDIVVLTGDFLSTSYNRDAQALAELKELLGQIEAPGGIYAVWGTAEVDHPHFLAPVLSDLGITVLDDRAVEVEIRGQRLWVMGLYPSRDPEAERAKLGSLMEDAPESTFSLLLYHLPDLVPQAAEVGVDLMLAGHTHGGQWRLPGFGAILTSSRYWKRYEAGHYVEGNTHLYVSRGLGMEGFGAPRARIFCRPEVVLATLSGAAGDRPVRSAAD